MKLYRFFWIGVLLTLFTSCEKDKSKNNVDITVFNYSTKKIDMVYLTTYSNEAKTTVNSLEINDSVKFVFNFKTVKNGDGCYRLRYKYSNSKDTIIKDIGYYSNGVPLESEFSIKIYNDSIG